MIKSQKGLHVQRTNFLKHTLVKYIMQYYDSQELSTLRSPSLIYTLDQRIN